VFANRRKTGRCRRQRSLDTGSIIPYVRDCSTVALTNQFSLIYIDNVSPATRSAPDLDRAVMLFHALSDATRLSIIEMLRGRERCVCELQDQLDAAQSRLSFHLRVLKEAGLISDRREGRWSYYRIVPEAVAEVHDHAVAMLPAKGARPGLRVISC